MKKWMIAAALLTLLPAAALATPGGTDANGGHYNHTTGQYHYHHGYAEHQHTDGICPETGEQWTLKIPEKPATLAEWNAMRHEKNEAPTIDNETPETAAAAEQTPAAGSAMPIAAAGAGAAAVAGGAYLTMKRRRKQQEAAAVEETAEKPQIPVMPEDTVIGYDGLPWEKEAYAAYQAEHRAAKNDNVVATNFAKPKWGAKYTFCTDADGEEIHTMDCRLAFIQVNAADVNCPKEDCRFCNPVRPDLSWYQRMREERREQGA